MPFIRKTPLKVLTVTEYALFLYSQNCFARLIYVKCFNNPKLKFLKCCNVKTIFVKERKVSLTVTLCLDSPSVDVLQQWSPTFLESISF